MFNILYIVNANHLTAYQSECPQTRLQRSLSNLNQDQVAQMVLMIHHIPHIDIWSGNNEHDAIGNNFSIVSTLCTLTSHILSRDIAWWNIFIDGLTSTNCNWRLHKIWLLTTVSLPSNHSYHTIVSQSKFHCSSHIHKLNVYCWVICKSFFKTLNCIFITYIKIMTVCFMYLCLT